MDVQVDRQMYVAESPAVDVARRTEREMEVPHQTEVTVIRELRAVAVAR